MALRGSVGGPPGLCLWPSGGLQAAFRGSAMWVHLVCSGLPGGLQCAGGGLQRSNRPWGMASSWSVNGLRRPELGVRWVCERRSRARAVPDEVRTRCAAPRNKVPASHSQTDTCSRQSTAPISLWQAAAGASVPRRRPRKPRRGSAGGRMRRALSPGQQVRLPGEPPVPAERVPPRLLSLPGRAPHSAPRGVAPPRLQPLCARFHPS